MRSLILAVAALAFACGAPAQAPAPTIPKAADAVLGKRVDAVIDKLVGDQLVGVVVVIARDGKIVYERAAGFADREAKLAMREDTLFRLASMTKPIVSVAALALVDQGKLLLDDPVTKWLPDFRPKLADGREPVITVRHLITHTSGLGYKFLQPPDGTYHKAEISDGLAEPGLSAEVNLRRLASVPLLHEPGTTWFYSLSIDVLGEVVARAGGATLPEVVARLVTRPLAMADTAFVVTDRARLAWPYAAGNPPVRMTEPHDMSMMGASVRLSPARIFDPASFPSGGAGLAGTARDYLRFAEALRTGGAPLLSDATARAMRENQLGSFGFGVSVLVDPAPSKSARGRGTFGWAGIYGTDFWVDPPARLSVIVLTNVAGESPLSSELEKAIYQASP
jgi:CubicO group peptidase (beta-lactamase class C family)